MKFKKRKYSALSGNTEVEFAQEVDGDNAPYPAFKLIADKFGIRLEGSSTVVDDMVALQELAKVVSLAWQEHRSLMTKIVKPGEAG